MASTLKQSLGEGHGFISDEHGETNLYQLLKDMATVQNDLVAQFNQLKADYDAETNAAHTASSATDVTPLVTIE